MKVMCAIEAYGCYILAQVKYGVFRKSTWEKLISASVPGSWDARARTWPGTAEVGFSAALHCAPRADTWRKTAEVDYLAVRK